jgi:ubiquinone/menaquinone biosynthesis C-methylase UbiE
MYPFFYVWYKGKNLKLYMDFKSIVYKMTEEEFVNAYINLDCMATDRPTDLSKASIKYMLSKIAADAKSMLDVGCGRGYWLNKVTCHTSIAVTGCDLYDVIQLTSGTYVKAKIEKLPFADNSFDVVTCHHLLEHLIDLPAAIAELKRVTRKQLIIVVPCQRYYYYTLDMHINYFPVKEYLQNVIKMENYTCANIWGDWVYIAECE